MQYSLPKLLLLFFCSISCLLSKKCAFISYFMQLPHSKGKHDLRIKSAAVDMTRIYLNLKFKKGHCKINFFKQWSSSQNIPSWCWVKFVIIIHCRKNKTRLLFFSHLHMKSGLFAAWTYCSYVFNLRTFYLNSMKNTFYVSYRSRGLCLPERVVVVGWPHFKWVALFFSCVFVLFCFLDQPYQQTLESLLIKKKLTWVWYFCWGRCCRCSSHSHRWSAHSLKEHICTCGLK